MITDSAASSRKPTGRTAVLATVAGLIAAFGLASCCAIPLLLYTLGIGAAAWLTKVGIISIQYREALTCLAVAGLGLGAVMLWRQWRAKTCAPDALCARPWVRALTAVALLVGAVMLTFGYIYV
jgi:mercuric ion transport protein